MTAYYVGSGGSDANNGLTWATRKLTLNGAEDIPVAAGDTVYVAPGVYRETLTADISGSAGNLISYIADVTGENTDGVGGEVRITGSTNDQTTAAAYGITATSKNYRTFRGFRIDGFGVGSAGIYATNCTNWTVEDCRFSDLLGHGINVTGTQSNWIVRRCVVLGATNSADVYFNHTTAVDNANHVVENCLFLGGGQGVVSSRVGGVAVRNCVAMAKHSRCFRVETALSAGQTMTVNNCILYTSSSIGFAATVTGELVEDYNNLWNISTARTNVATGANSQTYLTLFDLPPLLNTIRQSMPLLFGDLSAWSPLAARAGASGTNGDIFGIARPSVEAKKSWGAVQFQPTKRDTSTVQGGSASLRLSDAGVLQMYVPTTNVSTTISVYVQWQANYAGTKPQMIVRQPGQSPTTVTATGGSGSWELLTTTLTPAAKPDYVLIELVSNNTATSGNFNVFFDTISVT